MIPRKRRRTRSVRPGAVENRERNLQRSQKQGLQPRTQLRPRKTKPRGHSGRLEPARLRNPYRLRHWRRSLARRTGKAWTTLQLLQQAGGDHRIPDLPTPFLMCPDAQALKPPKIKMRIAGGGAGYLKAIRF